MASPVQQGGARLPELSTDEINDKLDLLLQSLGNLSGYLEDVEDETIFVKTFTQATGCGTPPKQTAIKEQVEPARLGLALAAVEATLSESGNPTFKERVASCVIPDEADPGPLKSPSEIEELVSLTAQEFADLSAYVFEPVDNADVVLKTFEIEQSCEVLPFPTPLKGKIDMDRIGNMSATISLWNSSFVPVRGGEKNRILERPAECIE